jgi:Ice-binding-like/Secretion system C-terminal sorting domain
LSYYENSFIVQKNNNMKAKLLNALAAVILLFVPVLNFAQAPPLGTAAEFVLFSTKGAVSNTGISHLTGNVGSNAGSSTAFGNVNGIMHDKDGASAKCASDLLIAYDQLKNTNPTFFPAPLLGNGDTLVAGVYSISGEASLNLDLTLDAKDDPNAVFIFQIQGAFSTNAASEIHLINGAMACNVFWKVEGLISMATGSIMRGTLIANNAAIKIYTGCTLEGRALTTAGAITVDGILAYTPIGCGSPVLIGPKAPNLGSIECYAIFSSNGAVNNAGITNVKGDVGTNVGHTVGFDSLLVIGSIHPIPDISTAQGAADLLIAYDYLNVLPNDIELLYPAQFGRNLTLTPHTYLLDAATVFTDSLFLDAQGYENAVFIIKINGALSTSTYAKVLLLNGAQAKNVYWKVEGAVNINNYSVFKGTIISNNGALGAINTGVVLDGRALTTTGALTTEAATINLPSECTLTSIATPSSERTKDAVTITPNPFSSFTTIEVRDLSQIKNGFLRIYNILGEEVLKTTITKQSTTLETSKLPSGIYFYKMTGNNALIQSGKIIAKQ